MGLAKGSDINDVSGSIPESSTIRPKELILKVIKATQANDFVKAHHYSGKVVSNSQLHFGVFYKDRLLGVMQFGPPINKKGSIKLVSDTPWNGMLELNRMAFAEILPKNSESRCIGIAMRLIRKHYPQIEWVMSFSDATQCGDGTIYRASGFVLTDIRKSESLKINPKTGEVIHVIQAHHLMMSKEVKNWESTEGYQLRYVYFLKPEAKERLTVPVIPFGKIDEMGIGMYKGVQRTK